jgi:hypothetical protein
MSPDVTLKELLATWRDHRPNPGQLERLAATPGLAENWSRKLLDRSVRLKSLTDVSPINETPPAN